MAHYDVNTCFARSLFFASLAHLATKTSNHQFSFLCFPPTFASFSFRADENERFSGIHTIEKDNCHLEFWQNRTLIFNLFDMRGREIIVWRVPRRPLDPPAVLVQVDFEVFGDLQGVDFINHAKDIADHIGVRGWIKSTFYGTAIGQIQGEKDRVDEMALWLRHTGSPRSRIYFVDYQNWRVTDGFEFRKFNARV